MNYRQLQTELKTLQQKGLVAQSLRLNAPRKILAKTYHDYLIKQERKQILNNPLLVVWSVLMCLGLLIALMLLGLKMTITVCAIVTKLITTLTNNLTNKSRYSINESKLATINH